MPHWHDGSYSHGVACLVRHKSLGIAENGIISRWGCQVVWLTRFRTSFPMYTHLRSHLDYIGIFSMSSLRYLSMLSPIMLIKRHWVLLLKKCAHMFRTAKLSIAGLVSTAGVKFVVSSSTTAHASWTMRRIQWRIRSSLSENSLLAI